MSSQPTLPPQLETIFSTEKEPEALFTALMPALCEVLRCDRCFLYLRDPNTKQGRITHCYATSSEWEDMTRPDWEEEGEIAAKDPLMAIAFRTPEAVFVEDIETAGPAIVNLPFERDVYKHRALIHAPIYCQGQLCGILEPCVFNQPRVWTEGDRAVTALVQEKLAPAVNDYLNSNPISKTHA